MTWEWKIGDPVDDATGGSMDAMNWGHGQDEDDSNDDEDFDSYSKVNEYSKRAWDCYMEFREEEALYYINLALDLNNMDANNWNIKAIILEGMERFYESEKCYNRSLELSKRKIVYDNKARMLYSWSNQLLEESKELPDGSDKLREAEKTIVKAMNCISDDSDEDIDKYLQMKDRIEFYIGYENEFQGNLETLKGYDRSELFTITGRRFYKNNMPLTPGMPLKLVKEADNEFDGDAIAVYAKDEKIGYVANNANTKYELTSSASEINDMISDTARGEYLLFLDRYAKIQFHVARIVK